MHARRGHEFLNKRGERNRRDTTRCEMQDLLETGLFIIVSLYQVEIVFNARAFLYILV